MQSHTEKREAFVAMHHAFPARETTAYGISLGTPDVDVNGKTVIAMLKLLESAFIQLK